MAPRANSWKHCNSTPSWLSEQAIQNQHEADTWTSVGVITPPGSTLRDVVEQEDTSDPRAATIPSTIPDSAPVMLPPFENVIITITQIPHDPQHNREMPLLSCARRTEAEGVPCPLQPFSIDQLSYQQFTENIGWRAGKCLAYILPGQDEFRKVDNDSSFQAAVMRMRRAKYEDVVFYDVKDQDRRLSQRPSELWSKDYDEFLSCFKARFQRVD